MLIIELCIIMTATYMNLTYFINQIKYSFLINQSLTLTFEDTLLFIKFVESF